MYESWGYLCQKTNLRPGWYAISVCEDLARYYGRFLKMSFPTRGPHITIICGEKEENRIAQLYVTEILSTILSTEIHFEYDTVVHTNGRAFWLDCYSKQIDSIRILCGFKPKDKYHISIGNIKNKLAQKTEIA